MFRRRRKIEAWSPQQLVDHVRAAYAHGTTEDKVGGVSAALVLDQDPELLPRRDVKKGVERGDFRRYVVLEYVADDHNIVAYQLGAIEDMLVEPVHGFESLREAREDAASLVPGSPELEFHELPRIIQAGFIHDSLKRGGLADLKAPD